jgi:ketosteroid isomerase-like protein
MHDSATDPDTRTEAAVGDLLRCIGAGDIPELVTLFAPDAVWEVPGDDPLLRWDAQWSA